MASQLTRDEVAHVARLAHLELTSAELDTFTRQLADILAYAAIVQEAVVADVPGDDPEREGRDAGETGRHDSMRPDSAVPSIAREDVLAEAPDAARASGLFRVPRVR